MSKHILNSYIETIRDIKDYAILVDWFNTISKQVVVDPSIRNPNNYVYGCQVATWFKCSKSDNKLYFSFDSDSNLTKGVVKILLDVVNGSTSKEIKDLTFYDFKEITARMPIERQRTLQIILNKAYELANTTGAPQ